MQRRAGVGRQPLALHLVLSVAIVRGSHVAAGDAAAYLITRRRRGAAGVVLAVARAVSGADVDASRQAAGVRREVLALRAILVVIRDAAADVVGRGVRTGVRHARPGAQVHAVVGVALLGRLGLAFRLFMVRDTAPDLTRLGVVRHLGLEHVVAVLVADLENLAARVDAEELIATPRTRAEAGLAVAAAARRERADADRVHDDLEGSPVLQALGGDLELAARAPNQEVRPTARVGILARGRESRPHVRGGCRRSRCDRNAERDCECSQDAEPQGAEPIVHHPLPSALSAAWDSPHAVSDRKQDAYHHLCT